MDFYRYSESFSQLFVHNYKRLLITELISKYLYLLQEGIYF